MTSLALVEQRGEPAGLSLDDLVREIRDEHRMVVQGLSTAVVHAIRAGELLLEAKTRLPYGAWGEWLSNNTPDVTVEHARTYMRVARHRDRVLSETPSSLKAARKMLARTSARDVRVDPLARLECARLREEGFRHREIAAELGVSKATVYRWLNPEADERYRRYRAKTTRAGRAALKAQERLRLARSVGGDLGEGYVRLRATLVALQAAVTDPALSGEAVREIRSAMHSLYNAEDALDRAMKL